MNENAPLPKKKGFPWVLLAIVIIVISLASVGRYFQGSTDYVSTRGKVDLDIGYLLTMLKLYISEYSAPPTGDSAAVLKALRGENPRRIDFIWKVSSRSTKACGEFCDPWGHPYRIDTSNPKSPAVYSIGKNGIDEGGVEGSDDIASWR